MKNCVFNWSGGKDSTLALHQVLQDPEVHVQCLLTTLSDDLCRISMHGVRESLLVAQAKSLGLPLHQVRLPVMPSMEVYDQTMHDHLSCLKSKGISHAVFGDIFLEDLRAYREKKLAELGLKAFFPLWKQDTSAVLRTFISLGYKTVVVCAQDGLQHLCGRVIDESFLADLPEGIDPCGENGEFHTFVFDGPIFKAPVRYQVGDIMSKTFETADVKSSKYWFIDLSPL